MPECLCPGAGGVEPDCAIHGDNVRSAASGWRNLPAKPPEQSSAGVCGMHGCFIGPACPKCVTQAQVIYPGTSVIAPGLSMQVPL